MDNTAIILDNHYQPHLDEDYMSADMCDYFKHKLLSWRQEVDDIIEIDRQALESRSLRQADEIEDTVAAQLWLERSQQLHRHSLLRSQIEAALKRLEQGTYGYCEQTGDEIGFKRLQAWPIATLSLAVQAQQEYHTKTSKTRQFLSSWSTL